MALNPLGFEILNEEEDAHDALLAAEELSKAAFTLRLSRLLMAKEALKTVILSLKAVRNWLSI